MKPLWAARIAGGAAGLANGLFGGGGGMVFLPILSRQGTLNRRKLYATCVGVIFPVCLVSAAVYVFRGGVSLMTALPYLAGGLIGGWLCGRRVSRRKAFQGCKADVPAPSFWRFPSLRRRAVSAVTEFLIPFLCGLGAAVISAWGVGGGTLLLLVMTLLLGVDQQTAQGINLLFFLPTAAGALICHARGGYLDKPTRNAAVPFALPAAVLGAWLATAIDVELLRKPFGVYLLFSGISLIWPQKKKN